MFSWFSIFFASFRFTLRRIEFSLLLYNVLLYCLSFWFFVFFCSYFLFRLPSIFSEFLRFIIIIFLCWCKTPNTKRTKNRNKTKKADSFKVPYATEIDLLLRRKQILIPLQNKIDDNNTANISNGILTANELRLNSRVCQCWLYVSNISSQNWIRSRFGLDFTITLPRFMISRKWYESVLFIRS